MTLSRINHTGGAAGTTLSASVTAAATSATVVAASGWPSSNFVLKFDAGTASEEKVLVGSRTGTALSNLTRGYDGTTAASHGVGAAVEHDLAAVVIDDANDHIYTTTRDDHTQYGRTDGTRAVTGAQTFNAGITVAGAAGTFNGGVTVTAAASASTVNYTNAASGHTGFIVQAQYNAVDRFTVDVNGNVIAAGDLTTGSQNVNGTLVGSVYQINLRPQSGTAAGSLQGTNAGRWWTYSNAGVVRNTLDDGAGNMTCAGNLTVNGLISGPNTGVVACGFGASMANFGPGWQTCQYWQGPDGIVHLRGALLVASGATSGSVLVTVPAGLAPAATETFTTFLGSGAPQLTRVDLNTSGQLILQQSSLTFPLASTQFMSISGISWRPATI